MTASNGLWCTCMNNGRLGNFSLTERVKFIRSQLCSDEINILGAISTKWGLLSNFGSHSIMAVYISVFRLQQQDEEYHSACENSQLMISSGLSQLGFGDYKRITESLCYKTGKWSLKERCYRTALKEMYDSGSFQTTSVWTVLR